MSFDIDLSKYNEYKLNFGTEYQEITGIQRDFPAYVTLFINMANRYSHATGKDVAGPTIDLYKQCPNKEYQYWKSSYIEMYPNSIDDATKILRERIDSFKNILDQIDDDMLHNWAEDLIIAKSAQGHIFDEVILKHIAKIRNEKWRFANDDEISSSISGFVGDKAISIKSLSSKGNIALATEKTDSEVIYYKTTDRYIKIYENKNVDSL